MERRGKIVSALLVGATVGAIAFGGEVQEAGAKAVKVQTPDLTCEEGRRFVLGSLDIDEPVGETIDIFVFFCEVGPTGTKVVELLLEGLRIIGAPPDKAVITLTNQSAGTTHSYLRFKAFSTEAGVGKITAVLKSEDGRIIESKKREVNLYGPDLTKKIVLPAVSVANDADDDPSFGFLVHGGAGILTPWYSAHVPLRHGENGGFGFTLYSGDTIVYQSSQEVSNGRGPNLHSDTLAEIPDVPAGRYVWRAEGGPDGRTLEWQGQVTVYAHRFLPSVQAGGQKPSQRVSLREAQVRAETQTPPQNVIYHC